jgi:Cu/Ag efflux pump CusA
MLQLRYPTAALLAFGLLAVGGLGGYFLHRSGRPSGDLPPRATEAPRPKQPEAPDAPPAGADSGAPAPAEPGQIAEKLLARARPPAVVEVVAAYPGASAEEMERQVTVPLEVTLASTPRLESLRSKSLPGLCGLHARFKPGTDYQAARQAVINRLQFQQQLPAGVVPQIAAGPGQAALRYVLTAPRGPSGRPVYTPYDLKALQEWLLERELRRLPGVADVCGTGGASRRYEVQPDPDRLRRYGITLTQLQAALTKSNASVGGDYINQGQVALTVRGVGLFGGGAGPLTATVLTAGGPQKAAGLLRAAEKRRLRDLRSLVIASVNNQPIRVEDVVEGGRAAADEDEGKRGVVVASLPCAGRVATSGPGPAEDEDAVQGVVLLRPGADARLLGGVRDRIRELNTTAGQLLPGTRIEPFYASADGGEDALWVYGTFQVSASPKETAERAGKVRKLLRGLPEVARVVSQVGGPEAGDDLQSFNQAWFFVGLQAGPDNSRNRVGLRDEIQRLLSREAPGAGWLATPKAPEELGQAFPGVPAESLLKVIGPDLGELERLAGPVEAALRTVPGVENVTAYRSLGRKRLELRVDPQKCAKWGVTAADVNAVLSSALGGRAVSGAVAADKLFDVTIRWPKGRRDSETAILDLPVDVLNNQAVTSQGPGPAAAGGTLADAHKPLSNTPRLRLRDLVSPAGNEGEPGPRGELVRLGPSAIFRDQGRRLLPIRFSVRGRPLAEAQAEAGKKIVPLLRSPYRIEWSD